MLLVDTFYFNATWQHEFDFKKTSLKDFYISEGTAKQVFSGNSSYLSVGGVGEGGGGKGSSFRKFQ